MCSQWEGEPAIILTARTAFSHRAWEPLAALSEVPSGCENKSRSSSCPSCTHLRKDQKSSNEEFGSLNLLSLLLRVMVVLMVEVDSADFLVQHGPQQVGQGFCWTLSHLWCFQLCGFQDCCPARLALEVVCDAFCLPEQGGRLHGRVMLDSVCSVEFRQTDCHLPSSSSRWKKLQHHSSPLSLC